MRHYDPAPFFPEKRTLRPHQVKIVDKLGKSLQDMLAGTASYECEENGKGDSNVTLTYPPKVGKK